MTENEMENDFCEKEFEKYSVFCTRILIFAIALFK